MPILEMSKWSDVVDITWTISFRARMSISYPSPLNHLILYCPLNCHLLKYAVTAPGEVTPTWMSRPQFTLFFLNWSIVDLQCCISLRCIAKWFIYIYVLIYMYICIYVYSFLILFHYSLIQDIECNFLCYK